MQASVPLFSVVVPCHDYAHLLERAVGSVMRQPFRDFELLIVDDGSTDSTPEVAAALVQKHMEVRYLSQPNRGPAAVRNRAVDESHGRYLVFSTRTTSSTRMRSAASPSSCKWSPSCA